MKHISRLFVLIFILSITLSACSERGNSEESIDVKEQALTIYSYENNKLVKAAVSIFNNSNEEIKIEPTYFNITELTKIQDKMAAEIMAGEGPDIVYFDRYTFNSIYKTLNSGAFTDLNSFIEKENDLSDYNSIVLDSGIISGKRLFIPIDYYIPALCSDKEILKKFGLDTEKDRLSIDDFIAVCDMYYKEYGETGKEHFYLSNYLPFSEFLALSGVEVIDFLKGKADFGTPDFIHILQMYKKTFANVDYRVLGQTVESYRNGEYEMLKSGNLLFSYDKEAYDPSYLGFSYLKMNDMDMEIVVYPFPAYNTANGINAVIDNAVSININCKAKERAFEFLKLLISEELQKEGYTMFIPVNNKAVDCLTEKWNTIDWNGQNIKIPEHINSMLKNSIDTIKSCKFLEHDKNIRSTIDISVGPYLKGEQSEEQVIKELKYKMELYINE